MTSSQFLVDQFLYCFIQLFRQSHEHICMTLSKKSRGTVCILFQVATYLNSILISVMTATNPSKSIHDLILIPRGTVSTLFHLVTQAISSKSMHDLIIKPRGAVCKLFQKATYAKSRLICITTETSLSKSIHDLTQILKGTISTPSQVTTQAISSKSMHDLIQKSRGTVCKLFQVATYQISILISVMTDTNPQLKIYP